MSVLRVIGLILGGLLGVLPMFIFIFGCVGLVWLALWALRFSTGA